MSGAQDTSTHLKMNAELTADCVEFKPTTTCPPTARQVPLTPPPRTSKSRKNSLPQEHHERAKQIRKSMIDLPDHLHQRAERINYEKARMDENCKSKSATDQFIESEK